jgi:membrane protease YdiL (CAAX protease family)
MVARIFFAPDEARPEQRRLRAGWRILCQQVMLIAILLAWALFSWQLASLSTADSISTMLVGQFGTFIAINLSVYLARRFLDRRSMVSLGLDRGRQAVWDLLAGFMIAAVMMLSIYFIARAAGWLTFYGFAWEYGPLGEAALSTLALLVVFIIVGWQEELLSRGYLLQNIGEGTNLFWGVLLSSLLFALGHTFNPNMGALPLAGLFLAGLFLAYAYLRTRRLWLPIGLHIGWNFFESTVLGFPVSGMSLFRLIEHTIDGPEWLTGGAFGPEAGLVLLPALALGTFLVYYYTRLEASKNDL